LKIESFQIEIFKFAPGQLLRWHFVSTRLFQNIARSRKVFLLCNFSWEVVPAAIHRTVLASVALHDIAFRFIAALIETALQYTEKIELRQQSLTDPTRLQVLHWKSPGKNGIEGVVWTQICIFQTITRVFPTCYE
jgi:hypothetical protein